MAHQDADALADSWRAGFGEGFNHAEGTARAKVRDLEIAWRQLGITIRREIGTAIHDTILSANLWLRR